MLSPSALGWLLPFFLSRSPGNWSRSAARRDERTSFSPSDWGRLGHRAGDQSRLSTLWNYFKSLFASVMSGSCLWTTSLVLLAVCAKVSRGGVFTRTTYGSCHLTWGEKAHRSGFSAFKSIYWEGNQTPVAFSLACPLFLKEKSAYVETSVTCRFKFITRVLWGTDSYMAHSWCPCLSVLCPPTRSQNYSSSGDAVCLKQLLFARNEAADWWV